ncbi:2,3,4,5-tetrahydropyridine-2,6-dicarboxylate N-succinyltransferase [Paeniglutamicibacter antarcticus]|uniref:2,3,4,5-tetrahydropyridine-2,6-dicarboxylate N-succinyltransferase n=1 Tax=Paeniglutamicibacter antarcticus TaxID=494023 RepID=A0ABP9TQT8_9MICC
MTPVDPSLTPASAQNLRIASAHGLATFDSEGAVLDAWFPDPKLGTLEDTPQIARDMAAAARNDAQRGTTQKVIALEINLDVAPADAPDIWLRLHLLSHRLVTPNNVNLDGALDLLQNVVWTNFGPCSVADFELTRLRLRPRGSLTVYGMDKFPRMLDYVVPTGVRIAEGGRVRLGAHLAPGTTVMHEGFVNFNAGTLGVSMVEGRISSSVVVGDGSDVGGGASIMGTLSGGGKQRITIGRRVLLGANSGVGISIGDDSVVEAGLYVTAGSRVQIGDRVVKALELSGVPNLLFRRNSITGAVEALPRAGQHVELNATLHAN